MSQKTKGHTVGAARNGNRDGFRKVLFFRTASEHQSRKLVRGERLMRSITWVHLFALQAFNFAVQGLLDGGLQILELTVFDRELLLPVLEACSPGELDGVFPRLQIVDRGVDEDGRAGARGDPRGVGPPAGVC